MMIKLSTRKLASVLLAGTMIVSGSIALGAAANATTKQGAACSKLKLKSGIYTCIANPLKSSPKYSWANTNCIAAQGAYLGSLSDLATYTSNAVNASNKAKDLLASYSNALIAAQASLDDIMKTKVFPIEYVPLTKTPSVTAIGYDAFVAAYTAKLAADQAGIVKYTAALAKDVAGSNQALSDQKSVAAFTRALTVRQGVIDLWKRTVARINNTITSDKASIVTWTSTVDASVKSQAELSAQLEDSITSAKSARSLACKIGK